MLKIFVTTFNDSQYENAKKIAGSVSGYKNSLPALMRKCCKQFFREHLSRIK